MNQTSDNSQTALENRFMPVILNAENKFLNNQTHGVTKTNTASCFVDANEEVCQIQSSSDTSNLLSFDELDYNSQNNAIVTPELINSCDNYVTPTSPNKSSSLRLKSKVDTFLKFCLDFKLNGFSFEEIRTVIDQGKLKKKPIFLPKWKTFNLLNYDTKAHVSANHSAFAILTGKFSNVTVIDFDDIGSYNKMVEDFPQLKNSLTVKTRQGFHIYCKYDKNIIGRTHAFKSYPRVDLRNDSELLFAPPTTYLNCETKILENYTFVHPCCEIISIPEELKSDMVQFHESPSSQTDPSHFGESALATTALQNNKQTPQIITKSNPSPQLKTSGHQSTILIKEEIIDLLNALPASYFDSWENWFRTGAIVFHELGDNQESKDLFLLYSKKSEIYSGKVTMTDVDIIWKKFSINSDKKKITKASLYAQCKKLCLKQFYELQKKYSPFDFTEINSTTLAKHFVRLYGDEFIQNHKMGALFHWDETHTIWNTQVAEQKLLQLIGNEFYYDLRTLWDHHFSTVKNNTEPSQLSFQMETNKLVLKKLENLQKRDYKVGVYKDICTELPIQNIDFDVHVDQLNNLQFQNGVLMLNLVTLDPQGHPQVTNAFRNRTKMDYVSLTLPYSFEKPKIEDISFVQNIFAQIQPDQAQRDFQLGWLAYCLTGNTGAQVFKVGIGYSGSNGKSLEAKIHSSSFDIYSFKLNKNTFTEGNDKAHKQFIHIIRKPIRYAYMEELNRKKLDAELLKDFVDGHKLNVEIMYGTSEEKLIQSKLSAFSNTDLNVNFDGGIRRRGGLQYYGSEFVDPAILAAILPSERKLNQFPLIPDLEKEFLKSNMKLAYLWVLLPFVVKFYQMGFVLPSFAKDNFSSIAVEYDELSNALDEICIQGNEDDKVWKDDLVEQLSFKMNKTIAWDTVLPELKRLGYKYLRTSRTTALSGKRSCKGAVVGLKWSEEVAKVAQFSENE